MIRITLTGQDGIEKRLARIVPQSEAAVLRLAERIHELAFQGADRHTQKGAIIRSLGSGPRRIPGGFEIGHDSQKAPHAVFVHWGTKAHVIKPKNKKRLRFQVGGGHVFARWVNHPGYKGDPWLKHAFDRAIDENILETAFQKGV